LKLFDNFSLTARRLFADFTTFSFFTEPEPLLRIRYTTGTITTDTFQRSEEKLRKVNHSDRPPPFILAHVDDNPLPGGTLLDIFTSVLADLKQISPDWVTFATIFLSTNTQLNSVTPSVRQIAS